MKAVIGIVVGGVLAFMIACGGGSKSAQVMPRPIDKRAEIDQLDKQIAADMAKLEAGAVLPATAPDPNTCRPSTSPTCTESCTLKDSICNAANRICTIATDLGGTDAYANEKCTSGKASCDSAKQRCCGCT